MPFVPTILPALDAIRGIGGLLGLRVFSVTVRKRVWTFTGSRRTPGAPGSSKVDYDTLLTNQAADGSLQRARVRQVSRRDVISSGGQYAERDLKVGPLTPDFAAAFLLPAGGTDDLTLDPPPTSSAVEMIWILKGVPDDGKLLPAGGVVCEKRGEDSSSLHYYVFLRATGRQPT